MAPAALLQEAGYILIGLEDPQRVPESCELSVCRRAGAWQLSCRDCTNLVPTDSSLDLVKALSKLVHHWLSWPASYQLSARA